MKLTSSLFEAFLKCPTKCNLRSTGQPGSGNAYAEWLREQNDAYRKEAGRRMVAVAESGAAVIAPNAAELKSATWTLALDLNVQAGELESRLHGIERVPSQGRGKPAQFIPIRFTFFKKLTKDDRLVVALDALLLSEALGREVSAAKIVHSDEYATANVKIASLLNTVRALAGKMSAMLAAGSPPDLILNRHCGECEFRDACRQKTMEKDDLSLLSGMTAKERKKLHSKGIFTITQLSFTFHPRRRPKRLRNRSEKYHHSLKALAIRQKKIFIVGSPELKIDGTPVYLDVEGLPDRDLYYLIGLRVKTANGFIQQSFWVDSVETERKAWSDFLAKLTEIEKPILLHYGNYETTFLRRMSKRYGEPLPGSHADGAIRSAVNVLSFVFAQVYFPTYSNGLNEVGCWVGFRWSAANSSGRQAIVWRSQWEQSGDRVAKQDLIAYNAEDCTALQVLTEFLVRLCSSDARPDLENGTDPAAVLAESSASKDRVLRRFTSPIGDFEVINKAARWDFQRDRVYIRTDQPLRREAAKRRTRLIANRSRRKRKLPVNKRVICEPLVVCKLCGSNAIKQHRPRKHLLYDLHFSRSGVKRWVVEYRFSYYWCSMCQKRVGRPEGFWPNSDFGRNLLAFAIYQTVDLCVPQMTTAGSIRRLFGLRIGNSTLSDLKANAAQYYAETRLSILEAMLNGNAIHADETPMALKDRLGYVWVFANLRGVVYFYADSREGQILHEKLGAFRGVLVSDFYAAYDSLACPQQKCLLHLMRDLNEAVLAAPFDEELKRIALGFGNLLTGIVGTIDRWGLKRHFLNKHLADVDRFYRRFVNANYQSAAALRCVDRFEKSRQKLFTFLNHDGVPWNNNNAEHAIKAFTRLRCIIEGLPSPKSMDDYLILLSVCQTCKYSDVDFLDFVRSGKTDIAAFVPGRKRPPKRQAESIIEDGGVPFYKSPRAHCVAEPAARSGQTMPVAAILRRIVGGGQ